MSGATERSPLRPQSEQGSGGGLLSRAADAAIAKRSSIRRTPSRSKPEHAKHSFWYLLVSPRCKRSFAVQFRTIVTTIIIVDVIAFMIESDVNIANKYTTTFSVLEGFSSLVFTFEFIVRLATAPEQKACRDLSPNEARLTFLMSWEAIVDLLSFTPWYLEVGVALVGGSASLPNLQFLRVLRLTRLLKNWNILEAFDIVARVLYFNAEILFSALLICATMIVLTSTLLFFLRPPGDTEDDFSSIFSTAYLSIMMLTGQGQPTGELPWYTKAVCAMTSVFAVAQFAIPASMLTWGFEQEAERRMKKAAEMREQTARKVLRGEAIDADMTSSEESGYERTFADAWKEYEEVVVGSEDDEEKATGQMTLSLQEHARVLKIFSALDPDASGSVVTSELAVVSDKHGVQKLMNQIDTNQSGTVSSAEFLTWVCEIKKRVDSDVFDCVLRDLENPEQGCSKSPAGNAERRSGAVALPSTMSQSSPMGDQLMAFAQKFQEMEAELASLREQVKQKDLEIAELKHAKL